MLKAILKSIMYAVAPRRSTAYFSARARATGHRAIADWGCRSVNETLVSRFGSEVVGGPFRGMTLTPMTMAEQIGPYLLGTYEGELHPALEVVLRGRFDQIVDVGSKFGYYAVGLARRFPESRVVAFDTDWWAREALGEMIAANGVANVEVRGYCDPEWLAGHLAEGALIVSDCEGFEGPLFCSKPIPNLATATLLIETHDTPEVDLTGQLADRLGPTHAVRTIASGERVTCDLDLGFLDDRQKALATREVRLPQSWLLGLPHSGPNAMLRLEAAPIAP